jgi:hypothetical protein
VDVIIAVAMGLAIFGVALWAVRGLAKPPPPEPDPEDVVAVAQDYRCSVCGLRLSVTHAQGDDVTAPRHCREEMLPVS